METEKPQADELPQASCLIYLVRHGQTDLNFHRIMQGMIDAPLNRLGQKQAKMIADRLKEAQIGTVYTSPLRRALDTAREIVRRQSKVRLVVVEELRELSMGQYEGITEEELRKRYPKEFVRFREYSYLIPPPGGECLSDAEHRLMRWLTQWKEEAKEHPIVVVGHQGVNLAIKAHYLGLDLKNASPELAEKIKHLRQPNDRIDLINPCRGEVVGEISLSVPV